MRETQVAKFASVFQRVGRVPLTGLGGRPQYLKNKNFINGLWNTKLHITANWHYETYYIS
jgi:hypothetical protein